MTGLAFIWRKFYAATLALATGNLRLHDRLDSAYETELKHVAAPFDSTVPAELATRLDALQQRLAGLGDMADDDAVEVAGQVVAIYAEIVRLRTLETAATDGSPQG